MRAAFFVCLGAAVVVALSSCAVQKSFVTRRTPPQISWDADNLYVDGKPFFIRGINYSGINDDIKNTPVEQVRKDVALMKDLNINTVRLYNNPSQDILDVFYENGIFVIMEINNDIAYPGAWTDFSSDEVLKQYVKAARQQVAMDKSHPAILMWCLWNDGPFGPEVVSRYSQYDLEAFLGEMARAVK